MAHHMKEWGGGVQMGPLGTTATEWSIVLALGDYDDGEFGGMNIGRGNRSTRRKPAPAPLCPPQIPLDHHMKQAYISRKIYFKIATNFT
jgi:hypothetical protein